MIQVADLVASLRGEDDQFSRTMDVAGKAVEGLGKHTDDTLKHVREMGIALTALGTGPLIAAVKQASDFSTMLVHVQANTGITNAELATMSSGIKQLAASSGAPLDQLSEGFMRIHNSGFSASDALKILTPAMQSALSTGDDVGKVAQALGTAMHEFHIGTDQATASMNLLHTAAQLGNSTLGEFADGTTKALNLAGGFGLSLVDVAAALSTLTQSGQTARNASDGLSAAMSGFVKPTAGAMEMVQQLSRETGVNLAADFSAAGLKSRGLANAIDDVKLAVSRMGGETATQRKTLSDYADQITATGTITDAQFVAKMTKMAASIHDPTASLLQLFPNIRAFREMMLLTGSQSDAFAKNLGTLNDVMAGKLDPTAAGFAAQQATLGAQMAKLQTNVQILAINLGTVLLPPLTQLVAAVVPLVQHFADWASSHQQVVIGALAATAAIGALTVAATFLGPAIAVATGPVGILAAAGVALYEAWSHNVGGIQGIVAGMWAQVKPVFDAMTGAVGTLQRAFSSGGFGGAFASLPAALAPAREALAALGEQFVSWVGPAIPRFVEAIAGFGRAALVFVQEAAPVIGQQLLDWGRAFVAWVQPQIAPMVATLGGLLSRLGSWIANDAASVIGRQLVAWGSAFVAWVAPRIGPMVDALGGLLSRLGSWIANDALPVVARNLERWGVAFVGWVGPKIPPMLGALGGLLERLGGWVTGTALPAIGAKLEDWGRAFAAWVAPHIPPLLSALGGLLGQFGDWITGMALPAIGAKLSQWGGAFVAWVVPATVHFLQRWPSMLNGVLDAIEQAAPKIMDKLGHWADLFVDWLKANNVVPRLLTAFVAVNAAILTFIAETAIVIIQRLGTWADAFVNWVGDSLAPLKPALGLFVKTLTDWIATESKDLAGRMLQFGKDTVQGFIDGIKAKAGDLKSAAEGIPHAVMNSVKGLLGISSPSRVMAGYADDTVEGYVGRLIRRYQDFKDAGKNAASMVVTAFAGQIAAGLGDLTQGQLLAQWAATGQVIGATILGGMAGAIRATPIGDITAPGIGVGADKGREIDLDNNATVASLAIAGRDAAGKLTAGLSETVGRAIVSANRSAIASATPPVTDAHRALGRAIADALAAGYREGGDAIGQAARTAADRALATWSAMVPNFEQVAAEAAGRIKRIMAGEEPIGPAPGQQAPVTMTVDQSTIAPVASNADQIRATFAAITGQAMATSGAMAGVASATQGTAGALATSLAMLKDQTILLPDILAKLTDAKTTQDLTTAAQQAHTDLLNQENDARAQGNQALLASLQGQQQALGIQQQVEASLLRQVDQAQQVADKAAQTLATDQQRLATLQQQADAADQALETARQNLQTAQETYRTQQDQLNLKLAYDPAHAAQQGQLDAMAVQHARDVLSLDSQIQAARDAHNSRLVSQLTNQKSLLDTQYNDQRAVLEAVASQQNNIYQAQQTALSNQQQQESINNQLKKAQDAATAAASKDAQANAAVAAQQARVQADTIAANVAKQKLADVTAFKIEQDNEATFRAKRNAGELQALITDGYNLQRTQIDSISAKQAGQHATRMQQIAAENAAIAGAAPPAGTPNVATGAAANAGAVASAAASPSATLQQAIADMTKQFPKLMRDQGQLTGSLLAAGLAQGLGEQGAITYALHILSETMNAQLKKDWGIASPSRVMHEHGRNIVAGLVGGIRASEAEARAAMAGLFARPDHAGGVGVAAGGVGGGDTHISITIADGAVKVTGSAQGADADAIADKAAAVVARAIRDAVRTTSAPASPLLPGAQRATSGV